MSRDNGTIGPLHYVSYFGLVDIGIQRMVCQRFLSRMGYYLYPMKTYYIEWSTEKPEHNHYIVFEYNSFNVLVDGEYESVTRIFDNAMKDTPTNIPLYGWIEEEV